MEYIGKRIEDEEHGRGTILSESENNVVVALDDKAVLLLIPKASLDPADILPVEQCKWTEDEAGAWETDCGQMFEFHVGTPVDNGFLFCRYCGKELVEVIEESEDA